MEEQEKAKKPVYKKWWFWLIIICVLAVIGFQGGKENTQQTGTTTSQSNPLKDNRVEVKVLDFSLMDKNEIETWCETNKIIYNIKEEYSDTVEKGLFIKQSTEANKSIYQGDKITITYSLGKEPSKEYKNALKKAESYSKTMHMSKKAIYNQLISEYGEKFPSDAAQYAIDNIQADWNANALEKAKSYQNTMNMSKQRIYNQLISEYGEKFTKEEAQYAIDHLDD